MLKKVNNKFLFLLLTLLLTIPAIIGLLHSGFPVTDDGGWMVIRFSAFFQTLRAGEFPVRFLMRLNNGYGYPVSDFLYPLFMYLSVPIHIIGINFVNTIKTLLILSIFASSLFTFLWLRKIFDNLSSLVGALVYIFFPYYLFDVYQRGSVGEVLALSILPFVLWQIERKSLLWISVGLALLITAHNTLAVLFMFLIIPYATLQILIAGEKGRMLCFYITSGTLGLAMSAFFWLPALFDLQYTVFSKTQVSNISNYFSTPNLIGISTFLILLILVIFTAVGKIQIKKHRLTVLMFVVSVVSIFFAGSLSAFLWKILPSSFVQFPFRFLSLTIPSMAFIAACLVSVLSQKKKIGMSVIILLLVFLSVYSYLLPKTYQNFPDSYYSTNQDTTTVKNEYMPKWVQEIPQTMFSAKVENLNGNETINLLQATPNKTIFEVYLTAPRAIQINTIYFPGWVAYVNGKPAQILYNNPRGLINLNLNKGVNNVQVKFSETPVRIVADLISVLGLVGLLGLILLKKKIKL